MALPRGRHKLSAEEVEADQRRRMLGAMTGALGELGYARATVDDVLKGSGVSRRTFYEQFDDKEDCLLAAYDDAERRVWPAAARAVAEAPGQGWAAKVEAALATVLEFAAAEPDTARLFTLEARAAGPAMAERHNRAMDRVAALLRSGNRARADGGVGDGDPAMPEGVERTLLGNVVALIGSYVISGATELLPGLAPQLTAHLLSPYREETATHPASSAAAAGPR